MQLSSSVLFPPVCVLPIDASRFDEFLPEKKEIRQKMAARPDHKLSRSQGNLTHKTFLPKNTEQERNLGQRAGWKTADRFVAASATAHGCVRHVCECLYIVSPGKCHARGWVREVACGWVVVNPCSSPGLLCACFLSDSQAFSLSRPDRVLDLGRKVQKWLLAACLSGPLRAERLH